MKFFWMVLFAGGVRGCVSRWCSSGMNVFVIPHAIFFIAWHPFYSSIDVKIVKFFCLFCSGYLLNIVSLLNLFNQGLSLAKISRYRWFSLYWLDQVIYKLMQETYL